MRELLTSAAPALPLFALVLVGHAAARWAGWPLTTWPALTRFAFSVALPALLFRQMAALSEAPPIDARLLVAFFGGCLVVFVVGRVIASRLDLDRVEQSIFALGGIFSNNVLLGLPLAAALLGQDALPSVALVLVFNSLVLWTLVTASVEWARHGAVSRSALAGTVRSVLTNPVIAGILAGTAFGLTGASLPTVLDEPLRLLAGAAIPLALVALGAGLVQHDVRSRWQVSTGITILKLVACPLAVWGIAVALGLPPLETQVVTLLASVSVGTNVYLMANRFESLQGPVAASLVLSTALSAVTTPVIVTLVAA